MPGMGNVEQRHVGSRWRGPSAANPRRWRDSATTFISRLSSGFASAPGADALVVGEHNADHAFSLPDRAGRGSGNTRHNKGRSGRAAVEFNLAVQLPDTSTAANAVGNPAQ